MKTRSISQFILAIALLVMLSANAGAAPATAPKPPEWVLTGNNGTNPPTEFLGTTDNQPLVFKTVAAERIRINTTGEVGIGTTAPQALLDVAGQIRAGSGIKFGDGTTQTTAASSSPWAASGTDIYNTNTGNVGIGTTTPNSRAALDVVSSGNIDKYIQLTNSDGGSTAQVGVQVYNGTESTALIHTGQNYVSTHVWDHSQGAYLRSSGAGGLALAAIHNNGFISFHTGGLFAPERARINSAGNFGIGTTNPNSTLQVVGDYIQFPTITGSPPPDSDCDSAVQAGRVVVRTDGTTNLYICTGATGWVGK
jgi:hypothetical protein